LRYGLLPNRQVRLRRRSLHLLSQILSHARTSLCLSTSPMNPNFDLSISLSRREFSISFDLSRSLHLSTSTHISLSVGHCSQPLTSLEFHLYLTRNCTRQPKCDASTKEYLRAPLLRTWYELIIV
jgi:hypothetical protein